MNFVEPPVLWPDIKELMSTTRPLCVRRTRSNGITRIGSIELVVLVNGCLYLIPDDTNGFRAGDVLALDLDGSKRGRVASGDSAEQIFLNYESLCEARRGIGSVDGRYKKVHLPDLERWRLDANWLLKTAWTIERSDPVDDHVYAWRAERRIFERLTDRAATQLTALARFLKIDALTDVFEIPQTPVIPIPSVYADRAIEDRIQQVRGMSRRMDWRAIVLEQYVDQLRGQCRDMGQLMQNALQANDLFGESQTPKSFRIWANRLTDPLRFLRDVKVRGFSRIFSHAADELEEVVDCLSQAAQQTNVFLRERVRELMSRVFRTLILLDAHWRLEEMFIVCADHLRRHITLTVEQVGLFVEELSLVHETLTHVDPIIQQHVDTGFGHNVLPVVTGNVLLARLSLLNRAGANLPQTYYYLKMACSPL